MLNTVSEPGLVVGADPSTAASIGFRFGAKGTHTSRTIMLDELGVLLEAVPAWNARREEYADAIIAGNCLAKHTAATRRLTNQRLGELYGLEPSVPLFRVLRRLWNIEPDARPLLAILSALARDPLLSATWRTVISLPAGGEFQREPLRGALRSFVGDRLNDRIVDKVCRNIASSWTQSGHLEGRTLKRRRRVISTPTSVAFALYLGSAAGFRGSSLLSSAWLSVLDCNPAEALRLALEAKRFGLLDLRTAGDVFELNLSRLDPVTVSA